MSFEAHKSPYTLMTPLVTEVTDIIEKGYFDEKTYRTVGNLLG